MPKFKTGDRVYVIRDASMDWTAHPATIRTGTVTGYGGGVNFNRYVQVKLDDPNFSTRIHFDEVQLRLDLNGIQRAQELLRKK